MEARKIVKHGEATMMVSLPSKWVKNNNLKKGDELSVIENSSSIIFSTDKNKKIKKEITIKLTSSVESSVRAILTNLYRLGYDKIIINYSDPEILKVIEKELKNILIGFEIIKREQNKCIIENILEPSTEQLNNIFSKFILNIDEIFIIFEGFLNGKKENFIETEKQIQSFDNFCRRMITKDNISNSQLRLSYHNAIYHGQRELYYALMILNENKIKSNYVSDLLKEAKLIFETLKKSYDTKDLSLLEKIHKIENEVILNKGYDYLKKSKNPIERLVIHRVLSAIRNFYFASSPLIGLLAVDSV